MKSSVRGGRTLRRLLKILKIKNKTSSNAVWAKAHQLRQERILKKLQRRINEATIKIFL